MRDRRAPPARPRAAPPARPPAGDHARRGRRTRPRLGRRRGLRRPAPVPRGPRRGVGARRSGGPGGLPAGAAARIAPGAGHRGGRHHGRRGPGRGRRPRRRGPGGRARCAGRRHRHGSDGLQGHRAPAGARADLRPRRGVGLAGAGAHPDGHRVGGHPGRLPPVLRRRGPVPGAQRLVRQPRDDPPRAAGRRGRCSTRTTTPRSAPGSSPPGWRRATTSTRRSGCSASGSTASTRCS